MHYDAIVFDLDGVLLTGYHTAPAVYRAATIEALADFGVATADPPQALVDPDETDTVREFCEAHDVDPASYWGYREHAATVLENDRIDAGERQPFEDTAALAQLAETAALGIVSNNRHGTVRYVCDHFAWGNHVEAVAGRAPTLAGYDRMKPDPHYLHRVMAALAVDPADALFVGDRRSDVETARRAGAAAALLVRDGDPPAGGPDPDHEIATLRDLLE